MKVEDVNRCQIQEWYPKFKSISLKTILHELPESFIQYLDKDSVPFLLPVSMSSEDALPNRVHKPEDEEDFEVSEGSDDESEPAPQPPCFPELEMKISKSIESLGGAVFPKLNWSSPKDSAWISSTGTLKCSSFSDIALLLRSSDSIVHDLSHAYDSCTDKTLSRPQQLYLALRKWYPSFRSEMEFRCFVRGERLVRISQREVTAYYPALVESKDNIEELILYFFLKNIDGRFKSENYTFDIYVTTDGRVKLLDFNPWGAFTLPLLFTWEELERLSIEKDDDFEFRIVESKCAVRPGLKTAVPYDYLDTSAGSGWDQFLRNANEELQRQTRSPEEKQ
ncbi:Translation initiation factor eIF2 assembly protein-like protein [Drosera capensis]